MKDDQSFSKIPINRTEDNPFGIQKPYLEYYKPQYLKPNRMSSYGYQYKLAIETNKTTFLNVGSANNLLSFLLKKQDKFVVNLDIDWRTKPIINSKIPNLPFKSKSFDVVMCFQVLEHLPFSLFSYSIKEFKRIACSQILLSLPDNTQSKLEKLKYILFEIFNHPREWKSYRPRIIDPEHFWEIGIEEVKIDDVVSFIENEKLIINNHFRNEFNPFHHFFVLEILTK